MQVSCKLNSNMAYSEMYNVKHSEIVICIRSCQLVLGGADPVIVHQLFAP